jgi:hypothetical protein
MIERRKLTPRASGNSEDLTGALQARLSGIDAHLETLEVQVGALKEERSLLSRLLDIERARNGATVLKSQRSVAEIVSAGLLKGVTSKDQFKAIAQREGHEGVGRSVNAILMGYVRHGIVRRVDDDDFEVTDSGRETLSAKAEGFQ